MSAVQPTVSALVLTYKKEAGMTVDCVRSLQRQTIGGELQIIVIDNHSCDDSIGILRNRLRGEKDVRIVEAPRNLGYGKGNNLGARYALGHYLLIINPDSLLRPDALEIMVNYLKEHPDTGIVGPQLVFPNGGIRDSYRTFPRLSDILIKRTPLRSVCKERMRTYLQHDRDPDAISDVDWIVGAALCMERSLFERLGGFDPRFFLFLEDTDICRRCWALGKRVVYLPMAKADDGEQRLSSGGILSVFTKRTVRIHLMSAVRYFWKWRGASQGRCAEIPHRAA